MTVMKKKAYVCSDRLSRKQRSNRGLRQNPENSASLLLKSKPPSGKKYEKERNDAVCIKRPFGPKDFSKPIYSFSHFKPADTPFVNNSPKTDDLVSRKWSAKQKK